MEFFSWNMLRTEGAEVTTLEEGAVLLTLLVQNDVSLGDLQLGRPHLAAILVHVHHLEDVGVPVVDVGLAGHTSHVRGWRVRRAPIIASGETERDSHSAPD